MLHVYYRWIRWGISVRRDAGRTEPYVGGYMQSWDNLYIAHFMRERKKETERDTCIQTDRERQIERERER